MAPRTGIGVGAALAACLALGGAARSPSAPEGRDPTPTELLPSVEAAFAKESYAAGEAAKLMLFNRARGVTLQIFRSGPERTLAWNDASMDGVRVSATLAIGSSRQGKQVVIRIGDWASGLYFARLSAADGRVGFAPFVVRPRRLGEHRVAVVMPTLTWQAYNIRDDDGDGEGDSWYAQWRTKTARLGRPFLSRGVPYNFRRYNLPFLRWLAWTEHDADVLAQVDLEAASGRELRDAYDLVVFPGHHEYVTTREYDTIEQYRDLGGNLMFLSANNFFWRVVRHGSAITKTRLWRDLGRPEAALIGVQYLANGKAPRRPWILRSSGAGRWIFAGTGLHAGSRMGRGGVEIDRTVAASPPGVEVLAEIPDLFGRGRTAQMTYYETRNGAKVFAAGAFYFGRFVHLRTTATSRALGNLWARLAPRARN